MAAPTIQTDLLLITDASGVTNWNALGGGASGLTAETDFFIQGDSCVSKQCSAAVKGQIYNYGSTLATGTDKHILIWLYSTTPSGLAELAGGGLRATIGTATTAYIDYFVEGKTSYAYGGWKCYPIRYNTTTSSSPPYRNVVGTPGAAPQYFGGQVNCLATVKAANLGVDAIRSGTGIYIYGGDTGSIASFSTASANNDTVANRWGFMQSQPGGYLWQGKFTVGQNNSGTTQHTNYFVDQNATIIIPDTPHAQSTFTQMNVDGTGTTFNLTNITFLALGTNTPGQFSFLAKPTASSLTNCIFDGFGATVLTASVSATNCTWRRTGQVTQASAVIDKCTFQSASSAVSLVCNVPNNVSNCTFVSDGDNHAIQITTAGSCTFVGHKFTGYVAGTGSSTSSNAVVYNTSGGSVTISVTSGDAPSIRNSGSSTTTVITGQKTLTLTGLVSGSEVRIYPSGSTTELGGIELSNTTFPYTYTYVSNQDVNIVVFHVSYLPIYQAYTLTNADATLPINQITDRQYYNPP